MKIIVTDQTLDGEMVRISSLRQVTITNKYDLVGFLYRVVLIPDEYKDHPLYTEALRHKWY